MKTMKRDGGELSQQCPEAGLDLHTYGDPLYFTDRSPT